MQDDQLRLQAANVEKWLFNRSLSRRRSLSEVRALLGPLGPGPMLLVSGGINPVARPLLEGGGTWKSVSVNAEAPPPLVELLRVGPDLGPGGKLDLKDESVDAVVLLDILQHMPDDHALIAECHRVLKPTGRLIIEVPHDKPWSLLSAVRALFGMSRRAHGRARKGYTESMLFDLIKDGFDAEEVRSFSRFFLGLAELLADVLAALMRVDRDFASDNLNQELRGLDHVRKAYAWVFPFACIGAGLDRLIGFTRGYRLVGRFRRRPWKPRRAPTLKDGRSIAEATINTRIGTAAPF